MAKKRELSIEKRSAIFTLWQEKYSIGQIAEKYKISKSTVWSIIKKKEKTGSVVNRKRPGRPRVTSKTEDRRILTISKRNRRFCAPEITHLINVSRTAPVSISTVKRRLSEGGLFGRVAVRKPLLRHQNKLKRLQWAKDHEMWTTEDWKRVLWTDESKFEIFGSNRRVFVRRKPGERMIDQCVVPTVKHGGGSVMVWGCFGGYNTGDIVEIEGKMTKEVYLDILKNHAVPSGSQIIGELFIFQEDNDPKHSSKLCRNYLNKLETDNILKRMIWPPQSPDLSPIELLWDELDRNVKKLLPKNKKDLYNKLQNEWKSLGFEKLEKLISRMPKICKAVIAAKGSYIDESKI